MKVPAWMIFGLFIAILIMDLTSVWMVRGKVIAALDHSLDAALVAGVIMDDRSFGKLYVDENAGYRMACDSFITNMKLDSNYENQYLKDTTLQVDFVQNEERPEVIGKVTTVIKAISPKIFGLDGVPITIKKTMYHLERYKKEL